MTRHSFESSRDSLNIRIFFKDLEQDLVDPVSIFFYFIQRFLYKFVKFVYFNLLVCTVVSCAALALLSSKFHCIVSH